MLISCKYDTLTIFVKTKKCLNYYHSTNELEGLRCLERQNRGGGSSSILTEMENVTFEIDILKKIEFTKYDSRIKS